MLSTVGGALSSANCADVVRLCLQLGVDGFVLFLVEDLFCYQPVLENPDRIVLVLVFLDLLLLAVAALVLGVGDGVAIVSIGVELDDCGPGFIVRPLEGLLGNRSNLIDVLAVRLFPFNAKGLRRAAPGICRPPRNDPGSCPSNTCCFR